jgi:N-acetylglucosamine transport system permease protein
MKPPNTAHSKPSLIKLLAQIPLALYSLIVLFPMIWSIISSLKTTREFYIDVWALPKNLYYQNFIKAWASSNVGSNIINSVIVVSFSLIITMIMATTVAYAVTRYKFTGNIIIGRIFMAGLFVPLVLGTIPTFFVLRDLRLYDTKLGLILVYSMYSMPLSVSIMMGIFETIPSSFAEAAKIDGCGHFSLFIRIMFPLAKTGLVTISIFNFLWTWNDYIYAMTYTPSKGNRTLSVGLVQLTSTAMYQTDWGALFAGLVIAMLPSLIIYILFQNQIQKGLTEGGIKG